MAVGNKQKEVMDRMMRGLRGPAAKRDDAVESKALSAARGALGNTGADTKLASKALDAVAPRDPSNTYAGMSAGDSLESDSREAARKYPSSNRTGADVVAAPAAAAASMALPAMSLPAAALSQGALGAMHGAYTAPEGADRAKAAALGAGLSAVGPLAESAASALGTRLANMMPPPPPSAAAEVAAPGMARTVETTRVARKAPGEVQITKRAEAMLPPESGEALDESMIDTGVPSPKVPVEYSGKYKVDNGPMDYEPHETRAQYAVRGLEQKALQRQAQGKKPGPDTAPPPRSDYDTAAAMLSPEDFEKWLSEQRGGADSMSTMPSASTVRASKRGH